MAASACTAGGSSRLRAAVEPLKQFYFLRTDAQIVHGLQDWSTAEWRESLRRHPTAGQVLVRNLLGRQLAFVNTQTGFETESLAIRGMLREPLTMAQWRHILSFQNEVLNSHHRDEAEPLLHYMHPSLLSTMIFDREFPLGVEDSVMADKLRFAIQHSGLHRVRLPGLDGPPFDGPLSLTPHPFAFTGDAP